MANGTIKEFWKNCHFENMRAIFLLSCQNSLRWGKSLICHWNIDSWKQKLSFGYDIVPQNGQNFIYIPYRLHFVRIITIRGQYCWKSLFLSCMKMSHFRGSLPNEFWHLRGKPVVIFSKCLFFKNVWWYHEPYNQVTWRW